jgi:hypothetical protein
MQQQREHDYSHLFATKHADEPLATPQMSMEKGLKVFGKNGVKAVKKEMLQLHDRKVMEPKDATELTYKPETGGPSLPNVLEKEEVWASHRMRMH